MARITISVRDRPFLIRYRRERGGYSYVLCRRCAYKGPARADPEECVSDFEIHWAVDHGGIIGIRGLIDWSVIINGVEHQVPMSWLS